MAFDISSGINWPAASASTVKVTDLSAHVDGGPASSRGAANPNVDRTQLHDAAFIVIAAVVLLYLMGGIVFRKWNL